MRLSFYIVIFIAFLVVGIGVYFFSESVAAVELNEIHKKWHTKREGELLLIKGKGDKKQIIEIVKVWSLDHCEEIPRDFMGWVSPEVAWWDPPDQFKYCYHKRKSKNEDCIMIVMDDGTVYFQYAKW